MSEHLIFAPCRWLRLCLKAKWSTVYPIVSDLLAKQGRMKFIIPLYRYVLGTCRCHEKFV